MAKIEHCLGGLWSPESWVVIESAREDHRKESLFTTKKDAKAYRDALRAIKILRTDRSCAEVARLREKAIVWIDDGQCTRRPA